MVENLSSKIISTVQHQLQAKPLQFTSCSKPQSQLQPSGLLTPQIRGEITSQMKRHNMSEMITNLAACRQLLEQFNNCNKLLGEDLKLIRSTMLDLDARLTDIEKKLETEERQSEQQLNLAQQTIEEFLNKK